MGNGAEHSIFLDEKKPALLRAFKLLLPATTGLTLAGSICHLAAFDDS
jgi:hypothetical protein